MEQTVIQNNDDFDIELSLKEVSRLVMEAKLDILEKKKELLKKKEYLVQLLEENSNL